MISRWSIAIILLIVMIYVIAMTWVLLSPYTIPGARTVWMRHCVNTAMMQASNRIDLDYAFEHCTIRYEWIAKKEMEGWR